MKVWVIYKLIFYKVTIYEQILYEQIGEQTELKDKVSLR